MPSEFKFTLIVSCYPQIYQIVRKILDEQQPEGGRLRLSSHVIYDTIKRSNSSLNRKPKKLLEDSIERVLEVFQNDVLGDGESDSIDGDFDGLEEDKQAIAVCFHTNNVSNFYLVAGS